MGFNSGFKKLTNNRSQNIARQHSTGKFSSDFFAHYPWLCVRLKYILCPARRKACAGCAGVLVRTVRLTHLSLSLFIPCYWSSYDNRDFSMVFYYRVWGFFVITFI